MSDQKPEPTKPIDIRAGEIRTGAGLEEARYNVEFIEALRKYSTPVLLILAAIVAGYWGYGKWKTNKDTARAAAFAELEAQIRIADQGGDVSPDILLRIADDSAGQGAAPIIARLVAADQWLLSAGQGLAPGAQRDPATGKIKNADDVLTGEQKTQILAKAKEQYQLVLDQTKGVNAQAIFAIRATFGLAGVAETAGEWDSAKKLYGEGGSLAGSAGFPSVVKFAEVRAASVDELKALKPLVPESAVQSFVPPVPQPTAPATAVPQITVPSLQLNPSVLPPGSTPSPASAPAESPKP